MKKVGNCESLGKIKPKDLTKLFGKKAPYEALDLMQKTMIYDPAERWSIKQCLKHPWFKGCKYDFKLPEQKPLKFNFEDVHLSKHQIRCMVVDEVLHWNPSW